MTAITVPQGRGLGCVAPRRRSVFAQLNRFQPIEERGSDTGCQIKSLLQILQAAVTGLNPKKLYVLALAQDPSGGGVLQPLASFMSNPAGAAIVNSVGPIRQVIEATAKESRRYLVIASGTPKDLGRPVQLQVQP